MLAEFATIAGPLFLIGEMIRNQELGRSPKLKKRFTRVHVRIWPSVDEAENNRRGKCTEARLRVRPLINPMSSSNLMIKLGSTPHDCKANFRSALQWSVTQELKPGCPECAARPRVSTSLAKCSIVSYSPSLSPVEGFMNPVRIGILGLSNFVRNDWAACLSHWLSLMYLATRSLCRQACMSYNVPLSSKRASSSSQLTFRCFWISPNRSRCWALGPASTTMPEKWPANVTTTDLHQQALFNKYNLVRFLLPLRTQDKISAFVSTVAAQPAIKERAWFTDSKACSHSAPVPHLASPRSGSTETVKGSSGRTTLMNAWSLLNSPSSHHSIDTMGLSAGVAATTSIMDPEAWVATSVGLNKIQPKPATLVNNSCKCLSNLLAILVLAAPKAGKCKLKSPKQISLQFANSGFFLSNCRHLPFNAIPIWLTT